MSPWPEKAAHIRYHLGGPRWHESGVEVIPFEEAVTALDQLL